MNIEWKYTATFEKIKSAHFKNWIRFQKVSMQRCQIKMSFTGTLLRKEKKCCTEAKKYKKEKKNGKKLKYTI